MIVFVFLKKLKQKRLYLLWIICFCLIFSVNLLQAQHCTTIDTIILKKKKAFNSNQFSKNQIEKGFYTFSIDSIIENKDFKQIIFYKGIKYKGFLIDNVYIDSVLVKKNYLRNLNSLLKIKKLIHKNISYYANNGFPFVESFLDSISISSDTINANLIVNKGDLIVYDSIHINFYEKLNYSFISNYLKIKKNEKFSEKNIQNIDKNIQLLSFLEFKNASYIEFTENNRCIPHIYVEKRKTNQIEGLLTLNNTQENNKTKWNLRGNVNLNLLNAFNRGEKLNLNWKQINNLSQNLNTYAQYPFIFNTSMGVDIEFNFKKQDSSYILTQQGVGLIVFLERLNYLKFYYGIKESSITKKKYNPFTIKSVGLDFKHTIYGFEYNLNNSFPTLNPMQGWYCNMNVSLNDKKIKRNTSFPDSIYNNYNEKKIIFQSKFLIEKYFKTSKSTTLLLSLKGAWINDTEALQNELFYVGGFNSIRGFNENSFPASFYTILTSEYRLLTGKYSFFSAFVDYAYVEKLTKQENIIQNLISFGLGLNIETKAGIVKMNYSVGKQNNSTIDLQSIKINFGLINYF